MKKLFVPCKVINNFEYFQVFATLSIAIILHLKALAVSEPNKPSNYAVLFGR